MMDVAVGNQASHREIVATALSPGTALSGAAASLACASRCPRQPGSGLGRSRRETASRPPPTRPGRGAPQARRRAGVVDNPLGACAGLRRPGGQGRWGPGAPPGVAPAGAPSGWRPPSPPGAAPNPPAPGSGAALSPLSGPGRRTPSSRAPCRQLHPARSPPAHP